MKLVFTQHNVDQNLPWHLAKNAGNRLICFQFWANIKTNSCTTNVAFYKHSNDFLGAEHKVKLEARLRILEEGNLRRISGTGKAKAKFEKYQGKSEILQYPAAADSTLPSVSKRKRSESAVPAETEVKQEPEEFETPKQKKKKRKKEQEQTEEVEVKQELEGDQGELMVNIMFCCDC